MITIRKATIEDAHDITKVHIQAWQESYRGLVDQDYLDAISFEKRYVWRLKMFQNLPEKSIHLVALWHDQIIGFTGAGTAVSDDDQKIDCLGEIYTMYILEAYKHQGIGTRFMDLIHEHMRHHHLIPFVAWALKENRAACQFYAKLGGVISGDGNHDIGGVMYPEVAYVFGENKG